MEIEGRRIKAFIGQWHSFDGHKIIVHTLGDGLANRL
jgi:hypothetical protein